MTAASQYAGVRNDVNAGTQGAVDSLYQYRSARMCADISQALLTELSDRGDDRKDGSFTATQAECYGAGHQPASAGEAHMGGKHTTCVPVCTSVAEGKRVSSGSSTSLFCIVACADESVHVYCS